MTNTLQTLVAYIDPGTGAMVLQALIAGALGAGLLLRRFLAAPITWMRKSPPNSTEAGNDKDEEDRRQAA